MEIPVHEGVEAPRLTRYMSFLFVVLASATVFDGFDATILNVVSHNIYETFGIDDAQWGGMVTLIRLGSVVSFFLLIFADRFGRRGLLVVTVAGYAIFTGLTALSESTAAFVVYQFFARLFLTAELALAIIVVGEEFPARFRGRGVGFLLSMTIIGTVAASFASKFFLDDTQGWRHMYFLGLAPLVLVFFLRFGMHETRRFSQVAEARKRERKDARPFARLREVFLPLTRRYRRRFLLVTLIWNCDHLVTTPAVTFWVRHARQNLGWDASAAAYTIMFGFAVGFFGYLAGGWLCDRIGRRRTCAWFYILAALFLVALFYSTSPLTVALMMGAAVFMFGGATSATHTYAAELFPTEIRATGYSWTTNLFGRVLEIASPYLIGLLAVRLGIPLAVALMAIAPVLGALVVLRYAPETKGLTLEEIDQTGSVPGA